ncbi:MAG: NHL repeat-containing protein, partial [Planctomycetota bacterium]
MLGGCDNKANDSSSRKLPDSFRYDISALSHIDDKDLIYKEKNVVDAKLINADAIAASAAGEVVVAVENTIHWFDASSRSLRQTQLKNPIHALTFDAEDRLLVGHRDELVRLDADGAAERSWPKLPQGAHITSVAVDGPDIVIADAGNRTVIGYRGDDETFRIEDFVLPSPYFDVSIDKDGVLWVAHTGRHRIEAYDMTGQLLRQWGRVGMSLPGFSGCCNPSHFAVAPDGRFFTSEKGLHRVKIYSSEGELIGAVAGAEALGISKMSPAGRTPTGTQMGGPLVALHPDGDPRIVSPLTGKLHTF